MQTINIDVKNKIASNPENAQIVCDNSDYKIKFTFTEEWQRHEQKTARFFFKGDPVDVIFTGDECDVPRIENALCVYVGVFAGEIETTTAAYIGCIPSILSKGGRAKEPTPDVYLQLLQMYQDALATAQSVRDDADRGNFNGRDGLDGDDYVLTEDDKTEIEENVLASLPYGDNISYGDEVSY